MVGADLPVTVDIDILVAREAAAAVVEHHRILAVADDANLGYIGDAVIVASVTFRLYF